MQTMKVWVFDRAQAAAYFTVTRISTTSRTSLGTFTYTHSDISSISGRSSLRRRRSMGIW